MEDYPCLTTVPILSRVSCQTKMAAILSICTDDLRSRCRSRFYILSLNNADPTSERYLSHGVQ